MNLTIFLCIVCVVLLVCLIIAGCKIEALEDKNPEKSESHSKTRYENAELW